VIKPKEEPPKEDTNTLGEIRGILEQERQTALPPQPRRERLSAQELERRFKEKLLAEGENP